MKPTPRNPYIEYKLQDNLEQEQQNGNEDPAPVPDLKDIPDNVDFFEGLDREIGIPPENTPTNTPENKEETQKDQPKPDDKVPHDEGLPEFKRSKTQPKPNKEESMGILKKQYEDLKKEHEELKKGLGEFGETQPKVILKLFNKIKESANGPVTEQYVDQYLENLGATDKQIQEFKDQLATKEKKLIEYDINNSPEFVQKFDVPHREAYDSLFYQFAQPIVDAEGKTTGYLGDTATKKFHGFLFGKGDKNPANIQAAIQTFYKEFKSETGEEPMLINSASIMKGLREFHQTGQARQQAILNWSETKKQAQEQQLVEEQRRKEELGKASRKMRVDASTKAYDTFNHDAFEAVFSDEEIQDVFREQFKFTETFYEKPSEAPKFEVLQQNGAYAIIMKRMIDSGIWSEMVEAWKKAGGTGGELKGNGGKPKAKSGQEFKPGTLNDKDWLADANTIFQQ